MPAFWADFTTNFPPAAEIVRRGRQVSPFRGAPLRTGLRDSAFGRPGLLVVGEAAATTYPAMGEGIGKAMESALLATDFVEAALGGFSPANSLHYRYGVEFRRLSGNRLERRSQKCKSAGGTRTVLDRQRVPG